jgi:hypothetical protein
MPRRISGLSSGSKIPLRGFTQLLKNLDPGTRAQLELAFSQAENLIDFHSRTVPERQTRRRISGTISKPVVTAESTIIGAFVRWDRLDDPRITFYEIDISDNNAFTSSLETFTTLEAFFSVENVVTTKFVRVRGVRANGDTGLYSDTVTIRPTITAPEASSIEFYPGYLGDSKPTIGTSLKYGKDLNDVRSLPVFYTLLEDTFYADRLTGGFSVWGYASNRLRQFVDGGVTPWDRVRFKLNGVAVMDGYFPLWTNVMDENAMDEANKFDRDASGDLMTFYSQGGYTASFGPYAVTIPSSFAGDGPKDPNRIISLAADDALFYWTNFNNALLPSRFDQAQLESFDSVIPAHEAECTEITDGEKTDYIYFHNFDFDMPEDRVVTGIRAQVKRRQPNITTGQITPNLGVVRPDIADGDDAVLTNVMGPASREVHEAQILEDVDFGKFLDCSVDTGPGINELQRRTQFGPLQTDARGGDPPSEDPIGVDWTILDHKIGMSNNLFSISVWFNINSQAVEGFGSFLHTFTLWRISDNPAFPRFQSLLLRLLVSEDNGLETIRADMRGSSGTAMSMSASPAGANAALDGFHHFVLRWSAGASPGDVNDLEMYLNGAASAEWSTSTTRTNGTFTGPMDDSVNRVIGIGTSAPQGDSAVADGPFKLAQWANWDVALTNEEIGELFEGKGTLDYRVNSSDYVSSQSLQHYFLFFPEQPNILDHEVFLVDQGPAGGARVRDDLDNKALTGESWPMLGEFFYTDVRQYGWLPLPTSDGIPHDNHTAIGYQDYGGEGDLWGQASWTPEDVNNFYFGLAVRATNSPETASARGNAYIDHAKLTLYFQPEEDRSVRATVEASVANQFYLEREVFGALFNILEIGERLSD